MFNEHHIGNSIHDLPPSQLSLTNSPGSQHSKQALRMDDSITNIPSTKDPRTVDLNQFDILRSSDHLQHRRIPSKFDVNETSDFESSTETKSDLKSISETDYPTEKSGSKYLKSFPSPIVERRGVVNSSIPSYVENQLVPIILCVKDTNFLLSLIGDEDDDHDVSVSSLIDPTETLEKQNLQPKTNLEEFNYLSQLLALFDNNSILDSSIAELFELIREDEDLIEIHNFTEFEELVLTIPELNNITICEDNIYSRNILISDFTKIYNVLRYKTPEGHQLLQKSHLTFNIGSKKRFITDFNALNDLIRCGFGLEKTDISKKRKLETDENYPVSDGNSGDNKFNETGDDASKRKKLD